MKFKSRIKMALLVAGGILAILDVAIMFIHPTPPMHQHQERRPVYIATVQH